LKKANLKGLLFTEALELSYVLFVLWFFLGLEFLEALWAVLGFSILFFFFFFLAIYLPLKRILDR
jgi:hypothetical protein